MRDEREREKKKKKKREIAGSRVWGQDRLG